MTTDTSMSWLCYLSQSYSKLKFHLYTKQKTHSLNVAIKLMYPSKLSKIYTHNSKCCLHTLITARLSYKCEKKS